MMIFFIKGETKHPLWLEIYKFLTEHANNFSRQKVDEIIRGGIHSYR
jgi:hypothetical protein